MLIKIRSCVDYENILHLVMKIRILVKYLSDFEIVDIIKKFYNSLLKNLILILL